MANDMDNDMDLYDYQREVVQRALSGENIIIWLPTGSGKTRTAVYVAKRHLESKPGAKVVVLVNRVHLVDQHQKNEFQPHLGSSYRLATVSGDCDEKDFFGVVLLTSDLVICTAQILLNALTDKEEAKHVELSAITLLVIDECHHTQKKSVYNDIMTMYVKKKLNGERPLPQILGLTASPGAGRAKTREKAVEHILEICANLDSAIVSSEMYVDQVRENVPRPQRRFDLVDKRVVDPFEDQLKRIMEQIHQSMVVPVDFRLRECGTQEYEADVVELEKRGVREDNRRLAQCALHLRQYNDALLINDTLRMTDAYSSLQDFYGNKANVGIDRTDDFLLSLFQENQAHLRKLSLDPRYENPKMIQLEATLQEQFSSDHNSKGIIFCKTRKSTRCLKDWIGSNPVLTEAGITADILTGAGTGITYMSQCEQKDTIQNFRRGKLNLLISTSVAEEGLDIPECNLVVRYGLLTNEIAQQQASGRARARDSLYSVVAARGGREERREHVNKYLEELTSAAITQVQAMSNQSFHQKIAELQRKALLQRENELRMQNDRRASNGASSVKLLCRNCLRPVANGNDVKLLDGMHYVNVNPGFQQQYRVGGQVVMERRFEDWEPGCRISCRKCSKEWGFQMKYKKMALLPNLAIASFSMETPRGRVTPRKWKDVPFTVEDFDLEQYCADNFGHLLD